MDDQNKQMMDEMLSGLSEEQRDDFQRLAKETLAARMLDRIMTVLSDDEINELKALPENDAAAVEVYIQSKFSKEELEDMAREELVHIKERMLATIESVNDDMQIELDAQETVQNDSPADEEVDETSSI